MMTKLKAARLAKKMTQVHLAYHSGVAPTDISKFENGMARPYPSQAARLATILDLDPQDLLEPSAEWPAAS